MAGSGPDAQVRSLKDATYEKPVQSASAQPLPDGPGFLERLRHVVGEELFKEFELDTFRKQNSQARILGDQGNRLLNSWDINAWIKCHARRDQRLPETDPPERTVIVIEDIDQCWVERLDAIYGIDPLFVLAYAGRGQKHPRSMEEGLRKDSHPLTNEGNPLSDNIMGEWIMTTSSVYLQHSDWSELMERHETSAWWHRRIVKYWIQQQYHRLDIELGCCRLDKTKCKHGNLVERLCRTRILM